MRHSAVLVFSSAIALVFANHASADLVLNGDFESTNIGNNFYQTVDAGGSALTDWTVGYTSVDIVSVLGSQADAALWAHTGNQAVDLAGTPGPGSISQDLSTTNGAFYSLTFFASSNPPPTTLDVYWNGGLIASFDPSNFGTWTQYTYNNLQATSNSTELMFYTPNSGNAGPLLDGVSVTAVPEPASLIVWVLLGLTTGAATGWRRNK